MTIPKASSDLRAVTSAYPSPSAGASLVATPVVKRLQAIEASIADGPHPEILQRVADRTRFSVTGAPLPRGRAPAHGSCTRSGEAQDRRLRKRLPSKTLEAQLRAEATEALALEAAILTLQVVERDGDAAEIATARGAVTAAESVLADTRARLAVTRKQIADAQLEGDVVTEAQYVAIHGGGNTAIAPSEQALGPLPEEEEGTATAPEDPAPSAQSSSFIMVQDPAAAAEEAFSRRMTVAEDSSSDSPEAGGNTGSQEDPVASDAVMIDPGPPTPPPPAPASSFAALSTVTSACLSEWQSVAASELVESAVAGAAGAASEGGEPTQTPAISGAAAVTAAAGSAAPAAPGAAATTAAAGTAGSAGSGSEFNALDFVDF